MESAVRVSIGKEWGIYKHQSGNTVIVHASDDANHPKEPLVDRKNAFWIHSRQCSLVDWVLVGVVLVAYELSSCIPRDGGLMVG